MWHDWKLTKDEWNGSHVYLLNVSIVLCSLCCQYQVLSAHCTNSLSSSLHHFKWKINVSFQTVSVSRCDILAPSTSEVTRVTYLLTQPYFTEARKEATDTITQECGTHNEATVSILNEHQMPVTSNAHDFPWQKTNNRLFAVLCGAARAKSYL